MNQLRDAITDYLDLRRSLGFKLETDERLLLHFATFMERRHAVHITTKLAAKWAQQPASTKTNYHAGRLQVVRSFARYRILADPRSEIPPTDLLPRQRSGFQPHLFTEDEIKCILAASLRPLGGATQFYCICHYTIYGLLSVTGMRVSEAVNLDVEDVDVHLGVVTIRNSKFGKSRLIPVHETTLAALKVYLEQREVYLAGRIVTPFFISVPCRRIIPVVLDRAFRRLTRRLGMRDASGSTGPRLHDLRHTMAVEVLRRCYRDDANPERRLPALSTYLGHTHLKYTYWYLRQHPELMTEAMERLQHRWESLP